jgi:hypothetical protein
MLFIVYSFMVCSFPAQLGANFTLFGPRQGIIKKAELKRF